MFYLLQYCIRTIGERDNRDKKRKYLSAPKVHPSPSFPHLSKPKVATCSDTPLTLDRQKSGIRLHEHSFIDRYWDCLSHRFPSIPLTEMPPSSPLTPPPLSSPSSALQRRAHLRRRSNSVVQCQKHRRSKQQEQCGSRDQK